MPNKLAASFHRLNKQIAATKMPLEHRTLLIHQVQMLEHYLRVAVLRKLPARPPKKRKKKS